MTTTAERRLTFGVDRLCRTCLRHPGVEHAWHNGEPPKGSHEPPPPPRSLRAPVPALPWHRADVTSEATELVT
jgi:hypothetical protein